MRHLPPIGNVFRNFGENMKKEAEKCHVYKTLIQGSAEIDRCEFPSESEMNAVFNEHRG